MRSAISGASGGMRDGRVLSRSSPSTPSCMKRSCQRQTAVLATAASRMISAVPRPSLLSNTIRARQACFCELLRSTAIAASRSRSAGETSTVTPVRMPKDSHVAPSRRNPKWTQPSDFIHQVSLETGGAKAYLTSVPAPRLRPRRACKTRKGRF